MKVTKKIRNKYGIRQGKAKGKYPIFNIKSALSAIKLRHHSKNVKAETVLNKVTNSKFSRNPRVKEALYKARKKDRSR